METEHCYFKVKHFYGYIISFSKLFLNLKIYLFLNQLFNLGVNVIFWLVSLKKNIKIEASVADLATFLSDSDKKKRITGSGSLTPFKTHPPGEKYYATLLRGLFMLF